MTKKRNLFRKANRSWRLCAIRKYKATYHGRERANNGVGHIYLLQMGKSDAYKIGYAGNLESRLKALGTANPFLHCVASARLHNAKDIEKQLHREYESFRVKGEFFRFPDDIAIAIKRQLAHIAAQ